MYARKKDAKVKNPIKNKLLRANIIAPEQDLILTLLSSFLFCYREGYGNFSFATQQIQHLIAAGRAIHLSQAGKIP